MCVGYFSLYFKPPSILIQFVGMLVVLLSSFVKMQIHKLLCLPNRVLFTITFINIDNFSYNRDNIASTQVAVVCGYKLAGSTVVDVCSSVSS